MNWSLEYSDGVNLKPFTGGEFVLDFPAPPGHANLVGHEQAPIKIGSIISVNYKIKGDASTVWFKALDPAPVPPGLAPNFRIMLFNGDWYSTNGRWWPAGAQCAPLAADNQSRTYAVNVAPTMWTNVNGEQNPIAFRAFLKHMNRLYLAFSGGNSFSHGVTGKGARLKVFAVAIC